MIFNYWGLILFITVMAPNLVYAVKRPDGYENKWKNKIVLILEQIGRYSCMVFMILIVPLYGADILRESILQFIFLPHLLFQLYMPYASMYSGTGMMLQEHCFFL